MPDVTIPAALVAEIKAGAVMSVAVSEVPETKGQMACILSTYRSVDAPVLTAHDDDLQVSLNTVAAQVRTQRAAQQVADADRKAA